METNSKKQKNTQKNDIEKSETYTKLDSQIKDQLKNMDIDSAYLLLGRSIIAHHSQIDMETVVFTSIVYVIADDFNVQPDAIRKLINSEIIASKLTKRSLTPVGLHEELTKVLTDLEKILSKPLASIVAGK